MHNSQPSAPGAVTLLSIHLPVPLSGLSFTLPSHPQTATPMRDEAHPMDDESLKKRVPVRQAGGRTLLEGAQAGDDDWSCLSLTSEV
ncbi:hypothetical protein QQF64_013975 [Cirrhinus molitorella]|uniref:Uncharacterized protein n=1 Tax=Cirrhinus molitorella TaxID=172907 RepID=A0ABR3LW51_9TELE